MHWHARFPPKPKKLRFQMPPLSEQSSRIPLTAILAIALALTTQPVMAADAASAAHTAERAVMRRFASRKT